MRILMTLAAALPLAGCGLAETAAVGAAGAASEAKQAEAAKAQLDQVQPQLDAAQKTADEQRERAMKEAGQ